MKNLIACCKLFVLPFFFLTFLLVCFLLYEICLFCFSESEIDVFESIDQKRREEEMVRSAANSFLCLYS